MVSAMSQIVAVTVTLQIEDEAALRREVRQQLLDAGIEQEDADAVLDANRIHLAEVARLSIDRDLRPAGCQVEDSCAELEAA